MPEPVRGGQRYLAGLDGLRALAVFAVVAYHLGLGWAQGGLLGVGVFFTLSGYLITDILLGHWERSGSLGLGDFWLRRARRLLPALFVLLAVVAIWGTAAQPAQAPALRGDVVASLLYVGNWWFIAQQASYFARFGPPSPLGHLWSLSVEEQFYLLWPWLLLLGLYLLGRRRGGRNRGGRNREQDLAPERGARLPAGRYVIAAVTLAAAAASAVAMARLYHPGFDPTRPYEGTDTRACGLLIGAALAMVWPSRRAKWNVPPSAKAAPPAPAPPAPAHATAPPAIPPLPADVVPPARPPRPSGSRALDAAGLLGLAVIVALVWRTTEYSAFMFRGGMVVLSLATALVIAAVAHPASRLGRALGCGPLRWLGVRSYGIYLWHYPVIVLTAPPLGGMTATRAVATSAGSVGIAAVSWKYVEEPIRRWQRPRARLRGLLMKARRPPVPVVVGTAAGLVLLGGVAMAVRSAPENPPPGTPPPGAGPLREHSLEITNAPSHTPRPRRQHARHGASQAPGRPAKHAAAAAGRPRTSCRSVVHIGDSTSEGLISPSYLPDPAQRITARYAEVGVTSEHMAIQGATSVVETINNQPNAYDVAKGLVDQGYRGCWVIALGTNDTADVYVGSAVGRLQRIQRMMSVIGSQPVMWVDVKSLLQRGPYSEQDMQLWNEALGQAERRHPNMRVYDWSAAVRSGWYISDGIHYTSYGYAQRARLIADALASAFPAPAKPADAKKTAAKAKI